MLQVVWLLGKEKVLWICEIWWMLYVDFFDVLVVQCDVVFVYILMVLYYEVVNYLLNVGVYVCVDKLLVDKLSEVEMLVELVV